VVEILRGSPEAAAWSPASLCEFLPQHRPYFLVASQLTEIRGFIFGRRVAEEAEILNLAVRREYRRQAIGHRLVQAFLEIVAGASVTQVHLEVRESNATAIRLYRRAGFSVTGMRPGCYREPVEAAVLMSRHVSPVTGGNQGTG
jgi:ribosomal-protein-alanine acetyltransferase